MYPSFLEETTAVEVHEIVSVELDVKGVKFCYQHNPIRRKQRARWHFPRPILAKILNIYHCRLMLSWPVPLSDIMLRSFLLYYLLFLTWNKNIQFLYFLHTFKIFCSNTNNYNEAVYDSIFSDHPKKFIQK